MTIISKAVTAKISDVDIHPLAKANWGYIQVPQFLKNAITKFGKYPLPIAIKKGKKYYLLNFIGSHKALKEMASDEIELVVVDLKTDDEIKQFMFSFQCLEHKNPRVLLEQVRNLDLYRNTAAGKAWLDTVSSSSDKEQQMAELFGTSKHLIKCCLCICASGTSEIIEKLTNNPRATLSGAYKKIRAMSDKTGEEVEPSNEDEYEDDDSENDDIFESTSENTDSALPPEGNSTEANELNTQVSDLTKSDNFSNPKRSAGVEVPKAVQKLQQANKSSTKVPLTQSEFSVKKVIIVFSNDIQLELEGTAELLVEQKPVTSAKHLKLANNQYCLPNDNSRFLLSVYR